MTGAHDLLDINLLSMRIRNARKETSLSQIELAQLVGVSDKAISSYEVGRAVPPLDVLKKIAAVTGKQMSFFFNEGADNLILVERVDRMIEELLDIKKTFG
jgi:transcriptional regulator with XRE-family HTH domain